MSKAKLEAAAERMAAEFLIRCENPWITGGVGGGYYRRLTDDRFCRLSIEGRDGPEAPVRLCLHYTTLARYQGGSLHISSLWFANARGAQARLSERVLSLITGTKVEYSHSGWTSDGVPVGSLTSLSIAKTLLPPQPQPPCLSR